MNDEIVKAKQAYYVKFGYMPTYIEVSPELYVDMMKLKNPNVRGDIAYGMRMKVNNDLKEKFKVYGGSSLWQ